MNAGFAWAVAGCLLTLGMITEQGRAAAPDQPLVLETTIRLPGVAGRIDHMAVDLPRRRLFVAELGNNTVDVLDLAAGRVLHRIAGLAEPQGTAYVQQGDLVAVANAGDGSVRFFRGSDFGIAGQISLGDDADNIRVEPHAGNILVGYGAGAVAVIDPRIPKVLDTIKLPAHPESFQLAGDGARAFINIPEAHQVAVLDLKLRKRVAEWQIPGIRANFPMAIDPSGTVIAVVFRSPPRLILLDASDGGVRANLHTCGDADDVFFDGKRSRIYISCGQGAVDVFVMKAGQYYPAARIDSSSGARTSLYVPELDRLFVAARAGVLGGDAGILIYRPRP
jgi:hypothetical protein